MAILLSYPRSGNTWLRYCIEFLSKKPTGFPGSKNLGDYPICNKISGMGVDLSAPVIATKSHNIRYFGKKYDDLIVIVRDYKEVITRHHKSQPGRSLFEMFCSETRGQENEFIDYLKIIEQYDKLERKKVLVYYEDLIQKPKESILKVIDTLNVNHNYVDEFFNNYEFHKRQGIKSYHDTSFTKGGQVAFHQKNLPKKMLDKMTKTLKERNLAIYNKYLKRYE